MSQCSQFIERHKINKGREWRRNRKVNRWKGGRSRRETGSTRLGHNSVHMTSFCGFLRTFSKEREWKWWRKWFSFFHILLLGSDWVWKKGRNLNTLNNLSMEMLKWPHSKHSVTFVYKPLEKAYWPASRPLLPFKWHDARIVSGRVH